ncbi:MAG TPA: response regulator [Candidatus Acidoferrum sp.]|nr:response regulator [Candidatus Acidoferrum sp.]
MSLKTCSKNQRVRGDGRAFLNDRESIVFVVDDDPTFRWSAELLLRMAAYSVRSFATASEFLSSERADRPACLVTDLRLPGLSGLDLQDALVRRGDPIPIIFISGQGDIPSSVRAMKAGAVEFLTKPFKAEEFLRAVANALEKDRAGREGRAWILELHTRYATLTPRERGVMTHVVSGLLNKQVAGMLNTAIKTIKFHRAHVMEKMKATSLAELVRLAAELGLLQRNFE